MIPHSTIYGVEYPVPVNNGGILLKRTVIALLVFALLLTAVAPAAASHCEKDPLVYIVGRQETYMKDGSDPPVNAIHSDAQGVMAAVKKALPDFLRGVLTGDFEPWSRSLQEAIREMYRDYAPTPEGVKPDASGVPLQYVPGTLTDTHETDSIYSYEFFYDFRDDPWDVADDIRTYIEEVKSVTGHDRVNLISRCSGTAYAMTYLVKYGRENGFADISSFQIYDGTLEGFAFPTDFFTGSLSFDADATARYAEEQLEDDVTGEFLKLTVDAFNKTYGLKLGVMAVEDLYDKVKDIAFPGVLRVSYATSMGYWTMITPDKTEAAKQYVFGGAEDEYAALIGRIDRYHDLVAAHNRETLLAMRDAGVRLGIVCKYGSQNIPLTHANDGLSDNTVELAAQSFGATCSPVTGTLTEEQLAAADPRRVSPDRQIDATTCLLPESTWFVKDVPHYDFPDGVSRLLIAFCRYPGQMTVDSDPAYPQYLLWLADTDEVVPLTEENAQTRRYDESFFVKLVRFIRLLLTALRTGLEQAFRG